jgi:A/G-specific adenine glycosylase
MPGLLREVKKFYATSARTHLPWRKTRDPYKILVSEMMLQQTQVKRVLPFYAKFTKRFPTAEKLAKAPLSEVLKMWSGLGYNRRAKYLHEAAKIISKDGWKEKLPGVGPYTKAAVDTFAFNKPNVFIETNIRTVFLHHCFHSNILQNNRTIADKELLPLVAEALKRSNMQPRDFYAALMDYGAHLKRSGVRLNVKSKHYTKQSKFEGSARQLRGAIVRELLKKPATLAQLKQKLPVSRKLARGELEVELARLMREGMLVKHRQVFAVS